MLQLCTGGLWAVTWEATKPQRQHRATKPQHSRMICCGKLPASLSTTALSSESTSIAHFQVLATAQFGRLLHFMRCNCGVHLKDVPINLAGHPGVEPGSGPAGPSSCCQPQMHLRAAHPVCLNALQSRSRPFVSLDPEGCSTGYVGPSFVFFERFQSAFMQRSLTEQPVCPPPLPWPFGLWMRMAPDGSATRCQGPCLPKRLNDVKQQLSDC